MSDIHIHVPPDHYVPGAIDYLKRDISNIVEKRKKAKLAKEFNTWLADTSKKTAAKKAARKGALKTLFKLKKNK